MRCLHLLRLAILLVAVRSAALLHVVAASYVQQRPRAHTRIRAWHSLRSYRQPVRGIAERPLVGQIMANHMSGTTEPGREPGHAALRNRCTESVTDPTNIVISWLNAYSRGLGQPRWQAFVSGTWARFGKETGTCSQSRCGIRCHTARDWLRSCEDTVEGSTGSQQAALRCGKSAQ